MLIPTYWIEFFLKKYLDMNLEDGIKLTCQVYNSNHDIIITSIKNKSKQIIKFNFQ